MSVYGDFLEGRDPEDICGEPVKEEHRHWCDGCAGFWKHESPCDYETHRGVVEDWYCPMCVGKPDSDSGDL